MSDHLRLLGILPDFKALSLHFPDVVLPPPAVERWGFSDFERFLGVSESRECVINIFVTEHMRY